MDMSKLTKTPQELAKEPEEVALKEMDTSRDGLTSTEAAARLQEYGPNEIQKGKKKSRLWMFLKNFTSLMAILLWVGGIIAIVAGMPELGIAIWCVNVINGVFSYWQEFAAQKATDSLMKMLQRTCTCGVTASWCKLRRLSWFRGMSLPCRPATRFRRMPC